MSVIKDGLHTLDFDVDDSFFEEMECEDVCSGEVHINLSIDKQDRMFILEFITRGYLWVICDRCSEEFKYEFDTVNQLIVKYGGSGTKEEDDEDDDVIVLPEHQHYINIAQYLYEFIILSLPIRRIHPDDAMGRSLCNQETIDKLNSLSEKKTTDPRWEQLRNLLNTNNNKKV